MEEIVLTAVRRDVIGKQVKALRREGKLPAVIYGHGIQPIPILLDFRDASKALTGLSPSALVRLEVDGEPYHTLVREKQRNYILGTIIHIDFLAVSMKEKLRTSVLVEISGEAPAIKAYSALLVEGANQLEIECLPTDLVSSIVVDISGLAEIGDSIYVRDLVVSDKIAVLDDPDTMLVTVVRPEAEEVEEALEEEAGEDEPEVLERGKKEEEDF